MNITKKRGDHNRTRQFPGIRGRRPDLKADRVASAAARAAGPQKPRAERKASKISRGLAKP